MSIAPTHIAVHQKSRQFEVHFGDGTKFNLPCEYLRVFSPSAEVRAAKNRGELIRGKQQVNIKAVEPMGSYAIRILFDDGHDTGIYSWSTLKELGEKFDSNWAAYRQQLADAEQQDQGDSRVTVLFFITLVERLGLEKLELDLGAGVHRVADVIQQLRQRGDDWDAALQPETLTITVNRQFSSLEQQLYNGDEIAFVPKAE